MQPKKTDSANLELRRSEFFLIAVVLILSFLTVALRWNVAYENIDQQAALEDIIQDLDLDLLKKQQEMVAAISDTEHKADETNVVPNEAQLVTAVEPSTSTLLVGDGEGAVEEAKIEEVLPPTVEDAMPDKPMGFQTVEVLPEFPGGSPALMKWITENLKYPRQAKASKIKGTVVISFIIDTSGDVTSLKVEQSPSNILTTEVVKVFNSMPKWKPGSTNGTPCSTMVAIPLVFEL